MRELDSAGMSWPMTEARDRHGTFWVLEDPPPATRPRWFCHWNGADAPGFENVNDAVTWGLCRAVTVMIRTVGGTFYFAGERPSDWEESDPELRPWPPSTAELQQIDVDYEEALAAEKSEAVAREVYEREREDWLRLHHPELAGRGPAHTSLLVLAWERDAHIEFEELDPTGAIAGAREPADGRTARRTSSPQSAAGRSATPGWAQFLRRSRASAPGSTVGGARCCW